MRASLASSLAKAACCLRSRGSGDEGESVDDDDESTC